MKNKLFFLILCGMTGLSVMATDIQVRVGADLQDAINKASSGDRLLVQAGTFYGNFTMRDGVNVSGGWNESFTSQTKYGTILDGNASGRVVTHPMSGGSANNSVFSKLTIWSNLTIQNGKLTTDEKGAGVLLYGNSRVADCLIQNNINASSIGGGLAQDCDNRHDDIVAENCVIRDNKAAEGGGVFTQSTISNCIIESDTATTSTVGKGGGGVYLRWGRLKNCIVRNNYAAQDAGGVRAYGNCKLINCLIADNRCGVKTAGLALEKTLDEVINCTVVNNNQAKNDNDKEYCGIRFDSENDNTEYTNKFVNNVVWGNKANGVVQDQQVSYKICKYATATNNAIQGNVPNDFNTSYLKLTSDNTTDSGSDKAPKFTNPSVGDYSLLAASPLINAGVNTDEQSTLDCYGGPRQNGNYVDIGAFECQWIDEDRTVPVGQNLQYIINNTYPNNTVKVQAGTFYGNFTMKENVQLSGGWNESFTSQTDYTTILDAKGSGRVLNQPSSFSTMTIWSNFTIQNGNLTSPGSENIGSGVALKENGQVKHCLIQNNTFSYPEGNCLGGGVGSETTLSSRDLVMVDDCIIRNNTATHGGGVRIRGTIQNSLIEENRTTNNAAGGVQLNLDGNMYNCIVRNNHSGGDIGGVRLNGTSSDGTIANCLIYGNTAAGSVGGVGVELHNIINCTIVGNKQGKTDTDKEYCGVHSSASADRDRKFVNNIVWGNKAGDEVQPQQINSSLVHWTTRTNNAIQGNVPSGWGSYLSLDATPGFTNATGGDFTLKASSPMKNAGTNTYATGSTDLNGSRRTEDGTIDIGAYEYQMHYFNGNNGAGTDWNTASNWQNDAVPTDGEDIVLLRPAVAPASATTRPYSIKIAESGSLTVPASAAVVVTEDIQNYDLTTAAKSPTTTATLHIASASTGNGTLVWGAAGTPGEATVDFYTKSHGASGDNTSVNQYIGTPFSNRPAMLYQYYNSWMYQISYTDGVPGWTRLNGSDGLNAFQGYNLITAYDAGTVYNMEGTLVSNNNVTLNASSTPALVYNGETKANNENVLANSWVAPIKIANFQASDFTAVEATIYIFNAGSPSQGLGGSGDTPGNYSTYSIGTAGNAVIPSMQSFSVYTTGADPALLLDYSRLVQDNATHERIQPNKTPRRTETENNEMEQLSIRVQGDNGWADELKIFIREDFSETFENGWDAHKMFGYPEAPQLYAQTEDGETAIHCVPDADNTVIGFIPGNQDDRYTFSFVYDGEKTLYLNDLLTQLSTPVTNTSTCRFAASHGNAQPRFVLSSTPLSNIPTDMEKTADSIPARKIIHNGKLLIVRKGCIYTADGQKVK